MRGWWHGQCHPARAAVSDVLQIILAVLIAAGVWMSGRWAIRLLSQPGPEEPDPDDIVDVEVAFRCTVCGMRLTVTHAQGADVVAPRHCREDMEWLEADSGQPTADS